MKEIIAESLNLITNGVVITDPSKKDNPIVYVNKAFTAISGYSEEEVLGKNCRFLQGPDQFTPELDRLREAIKSRKPVNVVLKNYTKKGVVFWNELYVSPVRYHGKLYFIGVQQDVTARVVAQAELEEYKKRLELLVESRTKGLMEANKRLMNEIEENKQSQKKIILLNEKLMIFNKKLEKKLEKKTEKLTRAEEILIDALEKNPQSSLKGLSKKTGIPLSTISVARRRLLGEQLDFAVVPNLSMFGLLTVVTYRNFSLNAFPEEAFFGIQGDRAGIYLMLSRDWAQFSRTFSQFHPENGAEARHFETKSGGLSILGKSFASVGSLGKREATVLYGLCKFEAKRLSERLGISIPTIQKYVKSMTKDGKYGKAYFKKISKCYAVSFHEKPGNLFSAVQGKQSVGISALNSWDAIDNDSFSISSSDISLFKLDFSGAVKKSFLSLQNS